MELVPLVNFHQSLLLSLSTVTETMTTSLHMEMSQDPEVLDQDIPLQVLDQDTLHPPPLPMVLPLASVISQNGVNGAVVDRLVTADQDPEAGSMSTRLVLRSATAMTRSLRSSPAETYPSARLNLMEAVLILSSARMNCPNIPLLGPIEDFLQETWSERLKRTRIRSNHIYTRQTPIPNVR